MIYINKQPVPLQFFPDGSLNLTKLNLNISTGDTRITWLFEDIAEQVQLYHLVCFLKDRYPMNNLELEMPYFLDARMDRVKNHDTEVHTLKYFCKFINDLGFARVIVTDVHSPVTMSLLHRALEMNVKEIVCDLVDKLGVDYTFFPDKGALERYDYLVTRTPFYGVKKRNWDTGKIEGYEIENPYNIPEKDYQGKSALIIDDISSFGGTFFHASNALKKKGFGDIYLYVTHCENSILKGDVIKSDNVKHIFTTASIFTAEHPKITVLD